MCPEKKRFERRNVLKTGSIALLGLFGATGTAAATSGNSHNQSADNGNTPPGHAGRPEHAGPPDWAEAQNGRLQVTASRSEWQNATEAASEIEELPDETKAVSYEAIKGAVSAINEQIEAGNTELSSDGGEIRINPSSNNGGDD